MEKQEKQTWSLKITRTDNGYYLEGSDGSKISIEEDEKEDLLREHEKLLWEVMEYFGFQGSKHDPERIKVERKKQESWGTKYPALI